MDDPVLSPDIQYLISIDSTEKDGLPCKDSMLDKSGATGYKNYEGGERKGNDNGGDMSGDSTEGDEIDTDDDGFESLSNVDDDAIGVSFLSLRKRKGSTAA